MGEDLVIAEAPRALSGLDVAALGAALKINMPGFLWTHAVRAAAHGQIGRVDAAAADVTTLRYRPYSAIEDPGVEDSYWLLALVSSAARKVRYTPNSGP